MTRAGGQREEGLALQTAEMGDRTLGFCKIW